LDDQDSLQVIGFGAGRSASLQMAGEKAKMNAITNLADQVNGREFTYKRSEWDIQFTSSSKAMLTNTETVASYGLPNNTILTILTTPLPASEIDPENAFLMETEFRTDNLESSLKEKYQTAVHELISSRFKRKKELNGKLFLTDIEVSDFEVKITVLISIKQ
jgi:hypothetical protein